MKWVGIVALLVLAVGPAAGTEIPAGLKMPPIPAAEALDTAHAILRDRITLKGLEAPLQRRPDGGIDWRDTGPRNDKEWAWFLNRHLYFRDLCAAYHLTGEEQYLTRIRTDLADWLENEPSPRRLNFSPSWRPLEVARRLQRSWFPLFDELPVNHPTASEIRAMMYASMPDHAEMLYRFPSFWGGNHYLTEMTMLAAIASTWPEMEGADSWMRAAWEAMQEAVTAQTYPDGAYKELSNHYHRIALEGFDLFLNLAESSPLVDASDLVSMEERVEAMWGYFAGVVRPDGFGPLNNDSDQESNRFFIERLQGRPGAGDSDWLAFARELSAPAAFFGTASRVYPNAGHAVMRSDWSEHAEWAFFDAGPSGTAHAHEDALHLSLQLGGDPILVDAGRYNYAPGPWRDYFRGPNSHNTVVPAKATPVPRVRELDPPDSLLEAWWDGGLQCFGGRCWWYRNEAPLLEHRRWVLYRPGSYWIVLDEMVGTGPVEGALRWHFHPEVEVRADEGRQRLWTENDDRENIVLDMWSSRPARLSVRGSTERPVEGWYSTAYNRREASKVGHLEFRGRGPLRVVTLISMEDRHGASGLEWRIEGGKDGLSIAIARENIHWPSGTGESARPVVRPR